MVFLGRFFFIANPACCCCWPPLAAGEGPLAAAVVSVEGRLGLPAEVDSFALKGLCQEMNNFYEDLTNHICTVRYPVTYLPTIPTFCIRADSF